MTTTDTRPHAVIFDIDRTLADVEHLDHFFQPHLKDGEWRVFHQAAVYAPVIDWVADRLLNARDMGLGVIGATARPEHHRGLTMKWLDRNGLHMDALYMRPSGLLAPDPDIKRAMLTDIRQQWEPVHAYDDKPEIVAMWETEGIPSTLVLP